MAMEPIPGTMQDATHDSAAPPPTGAAPEKIYQKSLHFPGSTPAGARGATEETGTGGGRQLAVAGCPAKREDNLLQAVVG